MTIHDEIASRKLPQRSHIVETDFDHIDVHWNKWLFIASLLAMLLLAHRDQKVHFGAILLMNFRNRNIGRDDRFFSIKI
jgi:hypothetical protein